MTKRILHLTACLTFIFQTIHATTIQSNQTGNWNTASTWVGGIVPTNDDDVIVTLAHEVTIDDNMGSSSCKSLTVNGKLIYASHANFSVGNFNNRSNAFIVNGTFEYSVGYSFKVYGYLKFGTGSTFRMTSGGMIIDGALNAGTSVAAGQALLDVTDIGTLITFNSTIGIRNPHFDPATPVIKGAKRFGNTIAFGSGNTPDVNNDYTVSEISKPELSYVEVNIVSSTSRFKATNIVIDSAVSIISGTFYNYSTTTPIYVKGDFNVNPGVTVIGNIEFNGANQQNINPQYLSGATDITFHGDIVVNNPMEVKSKINVKIEGGDLKFIQGKFDTQLKTLTLERTPVNANSSSYVVTYNFYLDKGFLLIQNLVGNTLFPVGTYYSYAPVSVNATSGDFKVSLAPLASAPSNFEYVNLAWEVERVTGSSTADLTFQWNTSQEVGSFSSLRPQCRIYNYKSMTWISVTPTAGPDNTTGNVHTKAATGLNSFATFAVLSAVVLPVEISQFVGKKQDNRAQLTWTTLSEKNNQGFEIQKNTEGGNAFETIGFVKSQGNSDTPKEYLFWDNRFTQTAYYRLKQTDMDGKESFSKIITIENDSKKSDISVFPNPILRGMPLTIQLSNNADADDIQIEVFNAHGQMVGQQNGTAPLQTDVWRAGVYFVKIVKNKEVLTYKVIKND